MFYSFAFYYVCFELKGRGKSTMSKTIFTFAALVAFILAPSISFAGDAKVSYTAKKQGRVAFEKQTTQDETAAQENFDPAQIEPAAGGYEPQPVEEKDAAAQAIKLPRKN